MEIIKTSNSPVQFKGNLGFSFELVKEYSDHASKQIELIITTIHT
jgi:hypothetical protein